MPHPRRHRRSLKPDRRRALELLETSPDGCTEAIMLAHGLTLDLLRDLIHAGLAPAKAERVVAAGRPIEVARVSITEAGRGDRGENRVACLWVVPCNNREY
jgi:hypothetical protein